VVALRRVGNRYLGRCPFHQEKTPSFQLDAENQLFYCFGCGAGGDVLSFVMKHQGLSFGEAVQALAERYHVALPQAQRAARAHGSKEDRQALFQVVDLAGRFFSAQLSHSKNGEAARRYLEKRGIPQRVVDEQQLGYAPDRWDGLLQHLKENGVTARMGVQAGLLAVSAGERVYDRFRHRVIFPIHDDAGRLVAFGGRSLDGTEPKYLNSPETALYHKGRLLYNAGKAREACRQTRQVVLVEGYLDLLAFHAAGFYGVVATLGTALTPQQVRLLARFVDEVVLVYDADDAGERAMVKALPLFLQERLRATCIRLPSGMDPDDFLRTRGFEPFAGLLEGREDLGRYTIGRTLAHWDGTAAGKIKVIEELQPIFATIHDPVAVAEYLRPVAERLALTEGVIQQQLRHRKVPEGSAAEPAKGVAVATVRDLQAHSLEESIVRLMLQHPALVADVRSAGALEAFQEEKLKAIATLLVRCVQGGVQGFDLHQVLDALGDVELQQLLSRLVLQVRPDEDLEAGRLQLADRLQALTRRQQRLCRLTLLEEIRKAEDSGDAARVRQLLAEMKRLCSAKDRRSVIPDLH
jgi:DNA primase